MEFSKTLARYYHGWFRDCHDSAVLCQEKGDTVEADKYLDAAKKYFEVIINNWDAVEFFSLNDNAHKIDRALPVEFRGYK
jgi:hypothetical protein